MELAKHISEAQQLIAELSASKLKKRKGSNPASASSSPKGSPKSEEIKKSKLKEKLRSRSFSGKPSNSKIDPIYKQLADEALSKKQPNPKVPEGK